MKKPKIFKKKCPYCDKVISSLSSRQCEFNYYSHVGSCKQKYMKQASRDVEDERLSQTQKEVKD